MMAGVVSGPPLSTSEEIAGERRFGERFLIGPDGVLDAEDDVVGAAHFGDHQALGLAGGVEESPLLGLRRCGRTRMK